MATKVMKSSPMANFHLHAHRALAVILFRALIAVMAAEVVLPRAEDVWFFAPMDGSVDAVAGRHVLNADYRQWPPSGRRAKTDANPGFVDGKSGQAVFLGSPSAERHGDALTYALDGAKFPFAAGTIIMWVKPTQELASSGHGNKYLYLLHPSAFSARVRFNGTLQVYATGNHRHHLSAPLNPDGWVDHWHLIAVVWDGPHVAAYLDGELLASRNDVAPMENLGSTLNVGYRGFNPYQNSLPTGYADAAFQDCAIFSVALDADQIRALYAAGQADDYRGLLQEIETGALVELPRKAWLRGETIRIRTTPCGEPGEHANVVLLDDHGRRLATFPVDSHVPSVVSLDTAELCQGGYGFVVETGAPPNPDGKLTIAAEMTVRERRQPEFPFGFFASLTPNKAALKEYEGLGITLLTGNADAGVGFARALDRAFEHGIGLFPNLNLLPIWRPRYNEWKAPPYWMEDEKGVVRMNPEYKRRIQRTLIAADDSEDENPEFGSASPHSAIAFDMMTGLLDALISSVGDHPGLWALSFQDETMLEKRWDAEAEQFRIGDYGDGTVEMFKQRTGLTSAPLPPTDPPGTVWPVDHPYLQWVKHVGIPGSDWTAPAFSNLYLRLGHHVKGRRPDIHTGNYSGNEYGLSDYVMDWAYPTVWEPNLRVGWANGGNYLDYMLERLDDERRTPESNSGGGGLRRALAPHTGNDARAFTRAT